MPSIKKTDKKPATPIFILLAVKIAVTLCLWSLPLLFFPAPVFQWLGVPVPAPMVIARLLGAAYLALCAGYVSGIFQIREGGRAGGVLVMGLVSNLAACVLLFLFIIRDQWAGWSAIGRAYIWTSAVATFVFAAGLAICWLMDRKKA